MDSSEIIEKHIQLYDRFDIEPSLRMHMLRVAAVATMICDSWAGPKINRHDVISAALIHDIGNLAKFDFRKGSVSVELLKNSPRGIGYWKKAQKELIAKYGTDDAVDVTLAMAREIGANANVLHLIESDTDSEVEGLAKSEDYEAMIMLYSDERVGPFGILSVKERYEDLKRRYAGKSYRSAALTDEYYKKLEALASEIERRLMQKSRLTPEQINDKSAEPYILKYK